MRPRVKAAVRAMIAWNRRPEIVTAISFDRLVSLLGFEVGAREILIDHAGDYLIDFDRNYSWQSYLDLAPVTMRCINNGLGGNLRLINWRHRLRLARQAALDPTELRRVHRRQLNHGDPHVTLVMQQLAPY